MLLSGGWNTPTLRLWSAAAAQGEGSTGLCMVGSFEGGGGGGAPAVPGGPQQHIQGREATLYEGAAQAASRRRAFAVSAEAGRSISCMAALPGGLLATGENLSEEGGSAVRVWEAATGAHVTTLQLDTAVHALALLDDGSLACGGRGPLHLCDLATGSVMDMDELEHRTDVVITLAALEGGRVAAGCYGGAVHLWGAASGAWEGTLEVRGAGDVWSLAPLRRSLLAAGSADRAVRVWCVATHACLAVMRGHSGRVCGLAALPDGRLASGSSGDDGVICVWEVAHLNAGAPATAPRTQGPPCPTCGQRTLGPLFGASGSGSEHLCLFCRHLFTCGTAAAAGGGAAGAPAAAGGASRVAAPIEGAPYEHCAARLPHADGSGVTGLAVLEGGTLVSGGGSSTTLRLWCSGTGESQGGIEGARGGRIAPLPGRCLATAGWLDASAGVWCAARRARVCALRGTLWRAGHAAYINSVAALPGGLVATGSSDHTVRLWSAGTGAQQGAELQHGAAVHALALLGCGRLASGCHGGAVVLWSAVGAGAREGTLAGHTSTVYALAALPRGLLASGGSDATVRVWSVAAHACVAVLRGGAGQGADLRALAALPNGRLASGSDGAVGEVCVWEVAHLNAGAPATAPGTQGAPCPTCGQYTLGPLPDTESATHLCFLCRHVIQ